MVVTSYFRSSPDSGRSERRSPRSALGHLWTAPGCQEIEHVAALVGAAICSAYECGSQAAGHNALREAARGPLPVVKKLRMGEGEDGCLARGEPRAIQAIREGLGPNVARHDHARAAGGSAARH